MGTAAVVVVVVLLMFSHPDNLVLLSHPDNLVRGLGTLGTVNTRERPKLKQRAKHTVSATPSKNHQNPVYAVVLQ